MLFIASLFALFATVVAPFASNSLYIVTSGTAPGLSPGGNAPPTVTVPANLEDWYISPDGGSRLVNQYTLPGSLYSTYQYEGSIILNPRTNNLTVATRNLPPGIPIPSIPVNVTPILSTLTDSLSYSSELINTQILSTIAIHSAFSNDKLKYWLLNLNGIASLLIQISDISALPLLATPLTAPITFWNFINDDLLATTSLGPKMIKLGARFPVSPYQQWNVVNGFQNSAGSTYSLFSGFFQDRPNSLWLVDNYSPNSQLQRYSFEPTRNTWLQAERYGIPIPTSGPSTGFYIWQGFTGRIESGKITFYLHNGTNVFRLSLDPAKGIILALIISAPQGVRIRSILAPRSIPTQSPTQTTTSSSSATSTAIPTATSSSSSSSSASSSSTSSVTSISISSKTSTASPIYILTPSNYISQSNSPTITSSTSPSPTPTALLPYLTPTTTLSATPTSSSSLTPSSTPSPSMPGNGTDPNANANQLNQLTPADAFGVSIGVIILVAAILLLLFCFGPTWIKASMKRTLRIDKFLKKKPEPPPRRGSVRDTVLQISENPMANATAASQQMLEMKRTIELQEERLRQLETLKSFANKTKIQFGPVQTQLPGAVV